ncbi:MAG TPA: type III pantothenate kinase [Candidatus Latescibacteria bacterium]|nr:type III pantothenate kinase [Candidatus Latescibacterota bacterium]
MLLALEIGNSNIHLGLFKAGELIHHWTFKSDLTRSAEAYEVDLLSALRYRNIFPKDIGDVMVASVVRDLSSVFSALLRETFQKEPYFVTHRSDLGIKICYNPPEAVGIDRLLGVVAAYNIYGGPTIVVDIGTAVTFNVVSGDGEFLGGVIAAGPGLCAEALLQKTDLLPFIEPEFPPQVIGRSTQDCLKSGLTYGTVELIDGLTQRIADELSTETKVVATGGLADPLLKRSRSVSTIDPFLVLKGLQIVHKRVEKGKCEKKREQL